MAINANPSEYKSISGLDQFYVAEVTVDSIAQYTAGTPEVLAPAVEISVKPVVSQETQYADNQAYDSFTSEAESDLEVTMTGLPSEMLAKLTGSVFDAATGRVFNNAGAPPWMALGFRAKKPNGKYIYVWLYKVQFTAPETGATTQADKVTPKTIKLAAKAIKTIHKWTVGSITDTFKGMQVDEDTDNASVTGFFTSVQAPGTTPPAALQLSSSDPIDGATGVAQDKTITLTFNNALPANAINNVVLMKADGSYEACTNSLDATKKIMTVNPDVNMTTGVHILAIGVIDIYGQDLQTVINWTCV